MSLIRKIGFEKYPEVRDAFGSAWGTILVASSFHRIEIVYDTYLEVSIKDSTRIARAKEEPIEIITFPPVIKIGHYPSVKSIFKYFQEITSL